MSTAHWVAVVTRQRCWRWHHSRVTSSASNSTRQRLQLPMQCWRRMHRGTRLSVATMPTWLGFVGVSSHQLDTPERGFSFKFPAALDMRLDPDAPVDAAHIVNTYSEVDLADVIFRYGEERASRRIAKLIVAQRKSAPITTTTELADLVAHALGGKRGKIHPATRTFQALRIAVNGELDVLTTVIPAALELLAPGGRLVIISFHSLEDRIVKHAFRDVCTQSLVRRYRLLTKHPLTASDAELAANPRSRSAKMRAIEYVG